MRYLFHRAKFLLRQTVFFKKGGGLLFSLVVVVSLSLTLLFGSQIQTLIQPQNPVLFHTASNCSTYNEISNLCINNGCYYHPNDQICYEGPTGESCGAGWNCYPGETCVIDGGINKCIPPGSRPLNTNCQGENGPNNNACGSGLICDRSWYLCVECGDNFDRNCKTIRGNDYCSNEQRSWFLANCTTGGEATPTPGGGTCPAGQILDCGTFCHIPRTQPVGQGCCDSSICVSGSTCINNTCTASGGGGASPTPAPGTYGIRAVYQCLYGALSTSITWREDSTQRGFWVDVNRDGTMEYTFAPNTGQPKTIPGLPESKPIRYIIIGDGYRTLDSKDDTTGSCHNAGITPGVTNGVTPPPGGSYDCQNICKQNGYTSGTGTFPHCSCSTGGGGVNPTATTAPTSRPNPTATTAPGQPTATTAPGQPTATTAPGTTTLVFYLTLDGVGSNTSFGQNNNPIPDTRTVNVRIFDMNDNNIREASGTLNYDRSIASFKGSISLDNVPTGAYNIKAKFDNTLWKRIGARVSAGQANNLPSVKLIVGDLNQDNVLDLMDYNILISCYGSKSCVPPGEKTKADLNMDGKVDEKDLNILYAEFSTRSGD